MKRVFKKMIVPMLVLGMSISLWSCTTKENRKIIFDSNEGSFVEESTKKVESEPIPTKKGYVFEGWFFSQEFKDDRVTFPLDLGKEDITLYAKWNLEVYTITYHLDGGTNHTSNPKTYTIEEEISLASPTLENKEFKGWYSDAKFQTPVVTIVKGTTGNKEFYAKWEEKVVEPATYTITYHLDGGTNHVENPITYVTGSTVTLKDPTKEGCSFDGWYSDAEFRTKVTGVTLYDKKNLDFYAKWEDKVDIPTTYLITYYLNGGNNSVDNPNSYEVGTEVILKDASKVGYIFEGWYTEVNYTNRVTCIAADEVGEKNLYAKFSAKEYTITYHLDGGTNTIENPATYTIEDEMTFLKPIKDHMIFKGWYTEPEFKNLITQIEAGSMGDLHLYVKWEHVDYTITYHLDGGINSQANPAGYTSGKAVPLMPATKLGYSFDGWYKDSNFTSKVMEIAKDSIGNLELYAKFTLEEYEITYYLNGGINGENPETYTFGTVVSLQDASKVGYIFEGWYTEANYTNRVTCIAADEVGEKNLYAKFVENYVLMYGTWSKDNYYLFAAVSLDKIIYNGMEHPYIMTGFSTNKISAGKDNISFTYNPIEDTITFVREYFKTEEDLDRTSETFTLNRINLPDTKDISGVYYTGDNRSVKDLVIDNYGHLTRFNGSDTYQGTVSLENGLLTLLFKTNNLGDVVTYTGSIVEGVITLSQNGIDSIYVKADEPKVYYSDNNIAVYQYKNFCVVEKDGTDYLATLLGTFEVNSLITLTYNDEIIKFRVKSLAGSSWGNLEAAKAFAGEYVVTGTEDTLVLDGFGPTNGTIGNAEFNGQEVQYSIPKYLTHILIIFGDNTEKYYSITDKTLMEITELDGLQGKYTNGSITYRISGLGYAIRLSNSYFEVYSYNQEQMTITISNMVFSIYHKGNVLLRGNSAYVKEGYVVEHKDFTEYLDKVYQNEENEINLRVSKIVEDDMESYSVTIFKAFTIKDILFEATTYDAIYVLDRLLFNGIELVLADNLNLSVDEIHTYPLTEYVAEQSFAEQLVGLYVYNSSYYVNIFEEDGKLKVRYSSSINAYSAPVAYDVTIEDESNFRAQYKYSSYIFAFTFANQEGVKSITFDNETYVDYSYRGKTFTRHDDTSVEIVSKNYVSKAGSTFSGSTIAVIKENGVEKSWTNINFVSSLTDAQKNVPGTYQVEVYAWVYGKKITANIEYTVIENYALSYAKKTIYAKENYGKVEIIASGMFTAKHNGVTDVITEDMITLPEGFDSKLPGTYTITCKYYIETASAVLTILADPTGHYSYITGETNTSYGTYFSSGFDVELVNDKMKVTIGSTILSAVISGNDYSINGKDITIKLLENGKITFTYTDSRWNEYTTTYAKPKEVDVTKYVGVYVNGSYYVRLFAEDKKLMVYYGSSINPYSDPTAYECLVVDEESGALQFTYSSYLNAFTFNEDGSKSITFGSETTVEYSYRGKTFTYYDSVVTLESKNYSSKAGTSPSASSLAVIKENGTSKNWTNIKFVTNLTTDQKNVLGSHEAEVYAWVYGEKIVAKVAYTVIENYSLSKSNKTINVQEGYGKAEIIASGMFTAKHNGATDVITEDMITLPEDFDSKVPGTYTITCKYFTEIVSATLTVRENPVGTYNYTSGNTTFAGYGIYFKDGFTLEEQSDGKYKLTSGSIVYENITLDKSYETPGTYKTIYVNVTETGIRIYEENYNYYCDYTKES